MYSDPLKSTFPVHAEHEKRMKFLYVNQNGRKPSLLYDRSSAIVEIVWRLQQYSFNFVH